MNKYIDINQEMLWSINEKMPFLEAGKGMPVTGGRSGFQHNPAIPI